jgi:hypothetical protein
LYDDNETVLSFPKTYQKKEPKVSVTDGKREWI